MGAVRKGSTTKNTIRHEQAACRERTTYRGGRARRCAERFANAQALCASSAISAVKWSLRPISTAPEPSAIIDVGGFAKVVETHRRVLQGRPEEEIRVGASCAGEGSGASAGPRLHRQGVPASGRVPTALRTVAAGRA